MASHDYVMDIHDYARARAEAFDDLFADNVYATRKRRGMSRRELAEITGLKEATIKDIETAFAGRARGRRRRVSVGESMVLAEALGLKPGDLLKAVDRG